MDDPDKAGDQASFEARLAAARGRQGLDAPAARKGRQADSPLGSGLRAGLEIVSALVVGVGLGLAADWWVGTFPLFLVIGLLLGGAAGVSNVWRLLYGRRG